MNRKLSCDLGTEDAFIMEFRELIDGNFIMILNGDKLKANVDSGNFSIDLNSPIIQGMLNPACVLFLKRIKTLMRGEKPDVIKKEINELNNDVKRINSFVKKYGFDSIEVPIVRDYFKDLVKKARDNNSNKSEECKKKLHQLIVAMSHTDKKVRITHNGSIAEFVRSIEIIEERADRFYKNVKEFCRDCEGKQSSYSKCEKRNKCQIIKDHIKDNFADWNQSQINKCLKYGRKSEYIEETIRSKFNADRKAYKNFKNYADQLKSLK
ncbi:MAG TPA: hypothetical protein PK178_01630 [Smithellaceae bacterium]|nr:hypothetical protein [Smithellaceae bacterium]